MGLELSQLNNLLITPRGSVVVAYLPLCVRDYLESPLGIAYLSQESLEHILEEHTKTDLLEMLCLPAMLTKGHWVADRTKAACVFYRDPASGRLFKSAVKCVAGYEIYVTTFHICTEKQTRSIIKRGATLRPYVANAPTKLAQSAPISTRIGD